VKIEIEHAEAWEPVLHPDVLAWIAPERRKDLDFEQYWVYTASIKDTTLLMLTTDEGYQEFLKTHAIPQAQSDVKREAPNSGSRSFLEHQAAEMQRECQYGNGKHYVDKHGGHVLPSHPHTLMKPIIMADLPYWECPECGNTEDRRAA
jgi:hypothetical protein